MKSIGEHLFFFSFFFIFLVSSLFIILFSYFSEEIYFGSAVELIVGIFTVFSIPLGVITGEILGRAKTSGENKSKFNFIFILFFVLIWNGVIFFPFVLYFLKTKIYVYVLKEHIKLVKNPAILSSVSGALIYYFRTSNNKLTKTNKSKELKKTTKRRKITK